MFKDYYKILGVTHLASLADIKRAYRDMSMKWHPDRNPNEDVTSIMQDINEAYAILKDKSKRDRYDLEYAIFYQENNKQESESEERNGKDSPNEWSYDYEVKDEHLKEDINNARAYAKSLVEDFLKTLKKSSTAAVKGAVSNVASYIVGWILAGIILSLLGIVIKSCNADFHDGNEKEIVELKDVCSSDSTICFKVPYYMHKQKEDSKSILFEGNKKLVQIMKTVLPDKWNMHSFAQHMIGNKRGEMTLVSQNDSLLVYEIQKGITHLPAFAFSLLERNGYSVLLTTFGLNEELHLKVSKTINCKENLSKIRDNYFNGNLNIRDYDYTEHCWDEAQQSEGWEWFSDGELRQKTEYYPHNIDYWVNSEHMEYRFIRNRLALEKDNDYRYDAYDKQGKLIRADNLVGRKIPPDIEKKIKLAIYKRDFLNNKYDINKASKKTRDALRAYFNKANKTIEDGSIYNYFYGSNNIKDATDILSRIQKSDHMAAENYLSQLRSDHWDDLKFLYKIERINNTSFKLYYLNSNLECGCVALMKWFNTAPYECEYKIELLSNEEIFILK